MGTEGRDFDVDGRISGAKDHKSGAESRRLGAKGRDFDVDGWDFGLWYAY